MAISKRLRYEILVRDGQRCRYCGAGIDEGSIAVDHVLPVVLGGSDNPSNLVAACQPCNAGKTSSLPHSERLPDVDERALVISIEWRAFYKDLEMVLGDLWYGYDHSVPNPPLPPTAPFVILGMLKDGFDYMDFINAVDQLFGERRDDHIGPNESNKAFDFFISQAVLFRAAREEELAAEDRSGFWAKS